MPADISKSPVHWVEARVRSGTNTTTPAAIANVATADADATYGQPEADLINEMKTKLNAVLAALRATGNITT